MPQNRSDSNCLLTRYQTYSYSDVSTKTGLTPRGAALLALVCVACAAPSILGGLHVIPVRLSGDTPGWLAVAAGSTFLLAAGALAIDALAGGIGPDGSLPAGASPTLRAAQSLCGFGIVVLFAVITSWIAFGKGERHFSISLPLPVILGGRARNDRFGRFAFGTVAVVLWLVVILTSLSRLRRLVTSRQRP